MQLTTVEAARVFGKLEIKAVACKHHVRGFLVVNGKRVLPVHYSNGRKDLPGNVPHLFRKSLHMSVEEFNQFLACTLSRIEYLALLRSRGISF